MSMSHYQPVPEMLLLAPVWRNPLVFIPECFSFLRFGTRRTFILLLNPNPDLHLRSLLNYFSASGIPTGIVSPMCTWDYHGTCITEVSPSLLIKRKGPAYTFLILRCTNNWKPDGTTRRDYDDSVAFVVHRILIAKNSLVRQFFSALTLCCRCFCACGTHYWSE